MKKQYTSYDIHYAVEEERKRLLTEVEKILNYSETVADIIYKFQKLKEKK